MGNITFTSRRSVEGKYVVLAGCDSGIGELVLRDLCLLKANVIALCYTPEGVSNAKTIGAKAAILCDVTKEEDILRAVDEIKLLTHGNWINSFIYCAGVAISGFIEFQTMENYRRVMEVNYFGAVSLTLKLLPLLRKKENDDDALNGKTENKESKRIVFVSSVCGLVALPGCSPYSASKFAMEAFASTLRFELKDSNISVSLINPGTMKTAIATTYFDIFAATHERAIKEDTSGELVKLYSREWCKEYVKEGHAIVSKAMDNPKLASNDIVHAVIAWVPQWRYLSGPAAKGIYYLLWSLPESWSFFLKKCLPGKKPY